MMPQTACAEDYRLAHQRAQVGDCDGACQEHVGPVRLVRVISLQGCDWGWWAYCEAAIAADRANGFRVTPEGCRHPNMESEFFQKYGPPDVPVDMVYWCPDCWRYFADLEGQEPEPATEMSSCMPDDSDAPF